MSPVDVELPAEASSAALARAAVRSALLAAVRGLDTQTLDRAVLLTSEVVTNAVLHARTPMRLILELEEGQVAIRVYDGARLAPRTRSYRPDAGTGRGMHLVEALADQWGVDETAAGKCVWFTIGLTASPRAEVRLS